MDLRNVIVSTDRLTLASFKPADANDVFTGVTPTLTRFMAFEPSPSPEAFAEVWRGWEDMMRDGAAVFLPIRRAATGEFLGMTGLHDISIQQAEVGIWIKEDMQGHGFGREAVEAAISWARAVLGIDGVIYPVAEDNRPSRRIAEALGGEIVGQRILTKPVGVFTMVVYRIS